MAQAQAERARAQARHLYYRARLNQWLGRRRAAADLCARALAVCDYTRAYRLLAQVQLPGADYFEVLEWVHRHVKPDTYLEIGVAAGKSLRLTGPDTTAIGIDPAPRVEWPLGPRQRIVAETSDDFFAGHNVLHELGGRRVRMAFIDGMHHFDCALRDFVNLEPLCDPDSLIFVHDCYPIDARSAAREQSTAFWSGDVWRLIVLLKRHRPDLTIHTIGTPPTGLGLITRLDPSSTLLKERLPALVAEGLALKFEMLDGRKGDALNLFPNDRGKLRALLDAH